MPDISSIQLEHFLPSTCDEKAMRKNFAVLIGRVLVKFVPFFKTFGKGLERHIQHEYSEDMSRKSDVVSLISSVNSDFLKINNNIGPSWNIYERGAKV